MDSPPNSPLHPDADTIAAEFQEYAYSVSHDLSAPVRAMVEFSKLLGSEHAEALNGEAREYLSLIVDNGEKLQQMMRGLLDYSRLNTAAQPYTVIDCHNLVQNCREVLTKDYPAAVIEVEPLPTLEADGNQMKQLFLILLENACKFQPAGAVPQVKVSSVRQNDRWQFSIADNGIGIDARFRKKIFKLFQRLHAEGEYPGAGIGLALAQKIVTRHGGAIGCEAGTGQGSTFLFTLPCPRE